MGEILEIWIASEEGSENLSQEFVNAIAGEGLDGDRYRRSGKADQEITFIEQEQLEWFEREHAKPFPMSKTRRNILTRDISLNDMVGRQLIVGEAIVEGMRLCQPCKTLQQRTGLPVLPAMINRGGLNCQIIQSGEIRIGDLIEPIQVV